MQPRGSYRNTLRVGQKNIVTLVGDSMMAIIEEADMAHHYQALYIIPHRHREH